jgi:hypothetical protein
MTRLNTALIVSALVRRVGQEGGFATIIHKGDESAGSILLLGLEKGQVSGLWERVLNPQSHYQWQRCGPQDIVNESDFTPYILKRRAADPDLWVVELDIADPARFAAESLSFD